MAKALVHEYLNQYGGAERVLQILCARWPDTPVYTMLYDRLATGGVFDEVSVRTSFLQRMPFSSRWHHAYTALMPLAVEQFDTRAFDTVLSISASFAKGIVTKPNTRHFCYCLTPPRFLWDDSHQFVQRFAFPPLLRHASPLLLSYLRLWDRHAAARVDSFIAISKCVAERIGKYYGRESTLVYPPVNVSLFTPAPRREVGDYFLMVGRLVAYKRFDLGIRAANALGIPLVIVGTGVEEKRLKQLAGRTVRFVGQITDDALAHLYARARAVIFPQEEDFGIVPLEAMASGRPVIAYDRGGAQETILRDVTGTFFPEQTVESLTAALERFDRMAFDREACIAQAKKFDVPRFVEAMERSLSDTH